MDIILRQEQASDFDAVYLVHCAAFRQNDEGNLVERLRKRKAYIPELSLVALSDNQVVGHICFSKIKITRGQGEMESIALAPMGVLPEFQNKGIGSLLVRAGLQKARELGYHSVIVLGHKDFYPRFGFMPASGWGIKAPWEIPDDVFMARELVPGGLDGLSGEVKYDEAFEEL